MTLIINDEQINVLRVTAEVADREVTARATQARYLAAIGGASSATEMLASVHYHAGIRDMLDYLFGKDATPLFTEFLGNVKKVI